MAKIDWHNIRDHPTWLNPNPTKDELEELVASIPKTIRVPWQQETADALKLKLAAQKEPSTIVSTMTREQLFLLNNPHWTDGLSTNQVEDTFYLIRMNTEHENDANMMDIFKQVMQKKN